MPTNKQQLPCIPRSALAKVCTLWMLSRISLYLLQKTGLQCIENRKY